MVPFLVTPSAAYTSRLAKPAGLVAVVHVGSVRWRACAVASRSTVNVNEPGAAAELELAVTAVELLPALVAVHESALSAVSAAARTAADWVFKVRDGGEIGRGVC